MAKKKAAKVEAGSVFTNGGNLPDGTRFEKGEKVPSGLSDGVIKSLIANDLIAGSADADEGEENE